MLMIRIKSWSRLIISLVVSQAAGLLGSIFTLSAIPTWYALLEKPWFNPPNVVFGPVWTTLYTLMGFSLYLVWNAKTTVKQKALQLFFVQLALNTLWSYLFFGLKSPLLGFLGIVVLWVAIVMTVRVFRRISKTASYLLYPYLAWVTFAMLLNFFIWQLN